MCGAVLKVPSRNQVLLWQRSSIFFLVPKISPCLRVGAASASLSAGSSSTLSLSSGGPLSYMRKFSSSNVLWNRSGRSPKTDSLVGFGCKSFVEPYVLFARVPLDLATGWALQPAPLPVLSAGVKRVVAPDYLSVSASRLVPERLRQLLHDLERGLWWFFCAFVDNYFSAICRYWCDSPGVALVTS